VTAAEGQRIRLFYSPQIISLRSLPDINYSVNISLQKATQHSILFTRISCPFSIRYLAISIKTPTLNWSLFTWLLLRYIQTWAHVARSLTFRVFIDWTGTRVSSDLTGCVYSGKRNMIYMRRFPGKLKSELWTVGLLLSISRPNSTATKLPAGISPRPRLTHYFLSHINFLCLLHAHFQFNKF
jgi:hypothetical protein